jgi:signal transduction histidine kinase/CHASE3 domain sensor protein
MVFGPALIAVGSGVLAFAALRAELTTRRAVIHTRDVLETSSSLLTALVEAEAGQRGYIITRDPAFLAPDYPLKPRGDSIIAVLRSLLRDNPAQQLRLDTIADLATQRLAYIDSSVVAMRSGQREHAVSIVAQGPGRRLMVDIHRVMTDLQGEEERLLHVREQAERNATRFTSAVITLAALGVALLAFLVNRNFDRALLDRRTALNDAQAANDRLQDQTAELETRAEAARVAALEAESARDHAHVALASAEASERRAERLQAATEAFSGALSITAVAQLIVDQALSALNADSGILAELEPATDILRYIAVRGVSVANLTGTISISEQLPLCTAAQTLQPVLLPNADVIRERFPAVVAAHMRDGVHAVAAFPLVANEQVLGSLLIRWKQPRTLSPVDVSFASALSRIAAEAFARARLFDAERDARAAAETANRAKAAFLASMSHELRTPLQAALGFSQLIRMGVYGPINEQQADALGRVERSQTHLTRLIDDILDFARLEAGHVSVNLESVSVTEVIADLMSLVEPQAAAKNIELFLLSPMGSLRVLADRQRLQQVLINLVGNAIKFTPERGIVRVSALRLGDHVVMRVRDTGMGIPADRLDAIFEPFVQVDDGLTRAQAGAGLGLAISLDLARAMGGDLTVESVVGEGSTFSIILPVGADD